MNKQKRIIQEKGITLIALIITIVVLLILAVVAIRAVQGDGIIQYARNARNDYEQAQANEQAQLQNYLDILDENNSKGDSTGPIVHNGVIPEGGTYYTGIQQGTAESPSAMYYSIKYEAGQNFPTTMSNLDAYKYGDYTYVYNGYFGGEPYADIDSSLKMTEDTSLDGWGVTIFDNYNQSSYGEILTTINGKNITNMRGTFYNCNLLTTAPEIPDTVTTMRDTFMGCTSLADISNVVIPNGVTDMRSTFENCNALTDASSIVIPTSTTNMLCTFGGCTLITKVPIIPSSVDNMEATFYNCTSLTGEIEINADPSTYGSCFSGVDFTAQNLTLTGSSNMLATLGGTGSNYQS